MKHLFKRVVVMATTVILSAVMLASGVFALTDAERSTLASDLSSKGATQTSLPSGLVAADASTGIGVAVNGQTIYVTEASAESYVSSLSGTSGGASGGATGTVDGLDTSKLSGVLDIEITPNTQNVEQLLSGAMSVIETILGIVVWLIVVGVTFFGIMDILFLTYPIFQDKVLSSDNKGGAVAASGKTVEGIKGTFVSMLVTKDARKALDESNNGGNPIGIYFKKRILAMVCLAVALYFVISGDFGFVMRIVINLASGIITFIQGLAT